MLNEFKDFIMKGNVMDLAVAVIIAGAFALITASLTLYSIPYVVITTNSLHSIKNYQDYTVEFNTLKEIAQVCGWVVSFATMYLATDLTKQ